MNKWERFRLEREKVLKKYCSIIKRSKIAMLAIKLSCVSKCFKYLALSIKSKKDKVKRAL